MELKPKTEVKLANKEVAVILKEALAAMEIKGANVFKIRAYQNAISAIESITNSVYDLWQNNKLDQISGMGASLQAHINELFTTGRVREFEALKKDLPAGMFFCILAGIFFFIDFIVIILSNYAPRGASLIGKSVPAGPIICFGNNL